MIATIAVRQRQAAKRQIIESIQRGASVQEARTAAVVAMHRTTVYRLLLRTQIEGEAAFSDGRRGHLIKLRGEVRTFLIDFCRASPSVSSSALQTALQDRFGLAISVSQLNRVRAALGLRSPGSRQEKKPSATLQSEPVWQESAGSLLLLADATKTNLPDGIVGSWRDKEGLIGSALSPNSPGHSTGLHSQPGPTGRSRPQDSVRWLLA